MASSDRKGAVHSGLTFLYQGGPRHFVLSAILTTWRELISTCFGSCTRDNSSADSSWSTFARTSRRTSRRSRVLVSRPDCWASWPTRGLLLFASSAPHLSLSSGPTDRASRATSSNATLSSPRTIQISRHAAHLRQLPPRRFCPELGGAERPIPHDDFPASFPSQQQRRRRSARRMELVFAAR